MATQIQRRRGTTAQHSTFTGALGELTVDTDKKTVVVHDGITAGGYPLAVASKYAPLASPALSGTPTAPTATNGTNTTQIATTAFVRSAMGNLNNFLSFTNGRVLTASDIGRPIQIFGTGVMTVTLPLASTCPSGSVITLIVTEAGAIVNIALQGANMFAFGNPAALRFGDTIQFVSNGVDAWWSFGGTLQLQKSTGMFGSSLSAYGYQKLPSGLIIQWGVTNSASAGQAVSATFAIAFPAACLQATMSAGTAGANVYIDGVTFTATTISGRVDGGGASIARYIAIGY